MSNKTKDKIQISFVGMNATEVTGSCIWIKTPSKQILLEIGLYQSCGSTLENYKINNKHFEFKAKEIDYVFICHTHGDHLNLAPLLYKRGGNATIIAPQNTKPLATILLEDCANIMENDVIELSNKFERMYEPIYGMDNVNQCLSHYKEFPMEQIIKLDENVKFRFVPSGHILNSAQLELWITEGNLTKKIAYTSDLGNINIKKYYTNKFKPIKKADIFISETTYAREQKSANKKMREKDLEKLESVIRQTCLQEHGRVLLPVFAQDRTQNMLTILYDIFGNDKEFKIPILIDSPMAIKMCHAYSKLLEDEEAKKWQEVLKWENVYFVEDYIESRNLRDSKICAVILSSSGMIVKGRSLAWSASLLPRVQDRIITCGYAPENSVAGIIKEGKQKTITISGKKVPNKCQITNLYSFTSHMQYDSLLKYLGKVEANKIILVHGEMDSKTEFSKVLQKEISKNNLTTKVIPSGAKYKISI